MKKPRTIPRKAPTQARARATVDAILAGTEKVLIKHGYEGASTNRVAAAAGVSIGSLYQYFPSKEALVLAVMERHGEKLAQTMEAELVAHAEASVPEMTRRLVRHMLQMHLVEPKLHRVLVEQVPRIRRTCMDVVKERLNRLVAAYLDAHGSELDTDDPALAAWLLINAVESLTHAVVLERPELLASPQLERNINQLVLRYLGVSARPARNAPARAAQLE